VTATGGVDNVAPESLRHRTYTGRLDGAPSEIARGSIEPQQLDPMRVGLEVLVNSRDVQLADTLKDAYLVIERTSGTVVIQVNGIRQEDVFVRLIEVPKGN